MRALRIFLLLIGTAYCVLTILGTCGVIDFKVCIASRGTCHVLFTDELPINYQPRLEI